MNWIDTSRVLPTGYYLRHFQTMQQQLVHLYGHWLDPHEQLFFQTLQALPEASQQLYLRLAGRQGPYFQASALDYDEIGNCQQAAQPLLAHGYLLSVTQPDPPESLLKLLPLDRLKTLAAECNLPLSPTPKTRKALIAQLSETDQAQVLAAHCLPHEGPFWSVGQKDRFEWLLFLYFGYPERNLSQFAIHDLLSVAPVPVSPETLSPRFPSRAMAQAVYQGYQFYMAYQQQREDPAWTALDQAHWLTETVQPQLPLELDGQPVSIAEKLTRRIARQLERENENDLALSLYETLIHPSANERRLKLLWKLNQKEDALTFAQQLLDNPHDMEERLLAQRFLERHQRQRLNDLPTQVLVVSDDSGVSIEQRVLERLAEDGWQGLHSENWLWRCLFGLTFWEELHQPLEGVYHTTLQWAPSDLRDTKRFWQSRQAQLEQRLTHLLEPADWLAHLHKVASQQVGTPNAFVSWAPEVLPVLTLWLERLPTTALQAVLKMMAQDIRRLRCGLPDLFVWREREVAFYEVKSPNDQLSRLQRYWISQFLKLGLPVWVLKARFSN